ncbi:hypothetical protein L596_011539 [Steinernema carpocapsae]|uniref:Uncharacterized protein n=1 Tax=Steinernema carpocapsae TaxID=34508 RepID=A0A4U5NV55_STECR|nr:hypothetical protein L596_011539 [Steinernema carpocapsae]
MTDPNKVETSPAKGGQRVKRKFSTEKIAVKLKAKPEDAKKKDSNRSEKEKPKAKEKENPPKEPPKESPKEPVKEPVKELAKGKEKEKPKNPEESPEPANQSPDGDDGSGALNEIRKDVDQICADADKRIRKTRKIALIVTGLLIFISVVFLILATVSGVKATLTKQAFVDRYSKCEYTFEHGVCSGNLCGDSLLVPTSKKCERILDAKFKEESFQCEGTKCKTQARCQNKHKYGFPAANGIVTYFGSSDVIQPQKKKRGSVESGH